MNPELRNHRIIWSPASSDATYSGRIVDKDEPLPEGHAWVEWANGLRSVNSIPINELYVLTPLRTVLSEGAPNPVQALIKGEGAILSGFELRVAEDGEWWRRKLPDGGSAGGPVGEWELLMPVRELEIP